MPTATTSAGHVQDASDAPHTKLRAADDVRRAERRETTPERDEPELDDRWDYLACTD